MKSKPNIHVIATGGTISGAGDSPTAADYQCGKVAIADLISASTGFGELADVQYETLFSLGSEDMGPVQWQKLACRINEVTRRPDVDGVVVTHGTDTLEECAFFLDLVCRPEKPVILTAAMRSATSLSADGPANLFHAVLAVASGKLFSTGIFVVMNGDIIPGWQVIKTDSISVDSFRAYPGGACGRVFGEHLILTQRYSASPVTSRFQKCLKSEIPLPHVEIKAIRGGDISLFLNCIDVSDIKGLVISGFGAGTLPMAIVDKSTKLMLAGVAVVVSSRVAHVTVMPETMSPGPDSTIIPSGILNPQKSAVLLSLALGADYSITEITKLFKYFSAETY